MRVILDGVAVTLDDNDVVGEGGEARVFGFGDSVLKIFHAGAPTTLMTLRAQKLTALRALLLPKNVMGPTGLVTDNKGAVVGYRMARVRDAVDVARLARPAFKAVVDQNATVSLFRKLLVTLRALHHEGVVVGDLNDGNVVVTTGTDADAFVIDADSMQLGGWPCPVAHERFLDPRLYGTSLVDGPAFSVDNDRYAFRVLLFQSLLGVHPYGGTHPKLPTLLRRAEARHSVLRDDVIVPRVALPVRALPDDLVADFKACFDDDRRDDVDDRLLQLRFVRCACGLEHAHRACPACRVQVVVAAVQVKGACAFELIVRGRAVFAASAGSVVRFVVDDGSALRREDGSVVVGGSGIAIDAGFVGPRTWLAQGNELVALEQGAVVDRTSTGTTFGAPVFAASPVGLFRLHGDAIVHHDSGYVVGRALVGRTWLFPVDDGCIALWRAGDVARLMWCRPGQGARDVALPPIVGKLRDLHVVADVSNDDATAVVCVAAEVGGRVVHRVSVVSRNDGVVASVVGSPDDAAILGNVRGKVVVGTGAATRVVSTSKHGLVLFDRQLNETARFSDTEEFVDDSVDLVRGSGGDLYVVADASVHLLRRRAATQPAHKQSRSTP